jgi:hypothetical protein
MCGTENCAKIVAAFVRRIVSIDFHQKKFSAEMGIHFPELERH